jgi:hypothetical protein
MKMSSWAIFLPPPPTPHPADTSVYISNLRPSAKACNSWEIVLRYRRNKEGFDTPLIYSRIITFSVSNEETRIEDGNRALLMHT